jgi:hypothetical protein
MIKNTMGESPRLFGFTLLYFDMAVELSYGLINPDLSRFDTGNSYGLTILVRDKANEYRLIKVLEPNQTVSLYYRDFDNGDYELAYVYTDQEDGLQIKETLNYEDVLIDVRLRKLNRSGKPTGDLIEVILSKENGKYYIRSSQGITWATEPLTVQERLANNTGVLMHTDVPGMECYIINKIRVRPSLNYPDEFVEYTSLEEIPEMYAKEQTRWLHSILTEKTREAKKDNVQYDYVTNDFI